MVLLKHSHLVVGLGITLVNKLTGNSTAFTIIDIEKETKTLTIRADIATPNVKMKYGADGYSIQCINQDEQHYTYSLNPEGETLHILIIADEYFIDQHTLILPGRRTYTDFTAIELEKLNNSVTQKV